MKPKTPKKPRKSNGNTAVAPWRSRDPDFAQQAERYAEPIPSRELILQTLSDHDGPMTLDDLIASFELRRLGEQEALAKRLQAMVRDGQLVQNRRGAYGPVTEMHLIAGVVQAHRDGFGFLIPDAGGDDVFLPPRQMRELMNGDRVLVRVVGRDFKGRPEGVVAEVIQRVTRSVVGRLHVEQGVSYVIPDNPRVQHDLLIPPEHRGGAQHGQIVVAEIVTPPGRRTLPIGRVQEVVGDYMAPGMEIEAAIRAHGLPRTWPDAVEAELAKIPDEVRPQDISDRVDLRDLPLVTIDGEDARDFDDAVYCRPQRGGVFGKGGWTLWVAIADVSAYVKPDTPLDKEALSRGTSVYFPQQVIPMLPEKLSNGLCSLNPHVDRLCMVCEMRVLPDGTVAKSRFYEAVMRSQARLTYDEVAEILAQPQGARARANAALVPHLQALDAVFEALFAARTERGAIDFDSTETRIVFSGERKIERIVPVRRNRAHRLIEECMIAANVQAAMFVARRKLPSLYRVHESPDPVKLRTLREFLALKGLSLGGGDKPTAKDYSRTIAQLAGRDDAHLVQTVMLRSMMQARYSPDNVGHFGLALDHYAHFTSPIRRYPDLLLHRAIKHALARGRARARREWYRYDAERMLALGAHCSMTERRADEATREVITWLKCEYMRHRIGEVFEGTVSSVAPFGLFVELEGLYIEGLVHVSSLRNDYYEHDAAAQRLVGSRSHTVYALGERVRVKVVRVNLDERKVDLDLVEVLRHSSRIKSCGSESAASRKSRQRQRKRT
ncbi:ribonuclease R [Sinimarinibacterium thermocellulolyticum]|uniref:Ribonuclease R n=1 Tax=Sinimarinibacterium thermocellulolyticum TaxID=3170016 RepID=A0ABV2AB80_9GAMM